MATTATKHPARADGGSAAAQEPGTLGTLQQTIDDLDRLRDQAGEDLRRQIDAARERIRTAVAEIREEDDGRAAIERVITRVADEAWQQLGTIAIRGLRDPEGLTELSSEIRKRKAQLRAVERRMAKP